MTHRQVADLIRKCMEDYSSPADDLEEPGAVVFLFVCSRFCFSYTIVYSVMSVDGFHQYLLLADTAADIADHDKTAKTYQVSFIARW